MSLRRNVSIVLLALALLASPVWADCVHDGEANVTGQGSAFISTPVTFNGKTTAGSNRIGVVAISYYAAVTMTSGYPTWNGAAMTLEVTADDPDIGMKVSLFYIIAPQTGASDIVVQWPDNITGYVITISSYNGCAQSTPIRSSGSASHSAGVPSDPITVTVSSTDSTDQIVDASSNFANHTPTVGANQTEMKNVNQGAIYGAMSRQDGTDGGVMSWSLGGNDFWVIAAMSIKGAGGAAASPRGTLLQVLP